MIHLIASSSRPVYLNQHPGAYEATCKKKTTNQPKEVYANFSKPVLGRQIKFLPRDTNHSMLRNQQRKQAPDKSANGTNNLS